MQIIYASNKNSMARITNREIDDGQRERQGSVKPENRRSNNRAIVDQALVRFRENWKIPLYTVQKPDIRSGFMKVPCIGSTVLTPETCRNDQSVSNEGNVQAQAFSQ
jgi:hypothetical protein